MRDTQFKRLMLSGLLTIAMLGAAPAVAQTHLNVQGKDMVMVLYHGFYDEAAGTFSSEWAEIRNGVRTGGPAATFVVPKGQRLVITDVDATVYSLMPTTVASLIPITIMDSSGTPMIFLTRVQTTTTSPGREQVQISFNAGHAIPEGFQLEVAPVDPVAPPRHFIQRAAFLGYYTK